jgi:hypothetical protein
MFKILREMKLTAVAALLAIALVLTAALGNIDLVTVNLKLLNGIEKNEMDDILCGLALIFVGLAIDLALRRKRHQTEIEAQKLRTLKATMRTVQDIVNNFLNNLTLFEMEAAAVMPKGSLDELEELTRQTFEKLRALGDLETVPEQSLAVGVGIRLPPAAGQVSHNHDLKATE